MQRTYEIPGESHPPAESTPGSAKQMLAELLPTYATMQKAQAAMIDFQLMMARRLAESCEALEQQLLIEQDTAGRAALAEQINTMCANIARLLFDLAPKPAEGDNGSDAEI